jgi:hypothetical protein
MPACITEWLHKIFAYLPPKKWVFLWSWEQIYHEMIWQGWFYSWMSDLPYCAVRNFIKIMHKTLRHSKIHCKVWNSSLSVFFKTKLAYMYLKFSIFGFSRILISYIWRCFLKASKWQTCMHKALHRNRMKFGSSFVSITSHRTETILLLQLI